jgi:hypothetical protein
MWRFQHDLPWGQLLPCICNGKARTKDIEKINNHSLQNNKIPTTVRYASCFNVNCDYITTAIFQEKLKCSYKNHGNTLGFILIVSDGIQIKDSTNVFKPFGKPEYFWEHFSENDIKMSNGTGSMDPVLKL